MRGRTKTVKYLSLFDPSEVFEASNKLLNLWRFHEFERSETIKDLAIKCRCKHPTFIGNVCSYRTCHHSEEDHF